MFSSISNKAKNLTSSISNKTNTLKNNAVNLTKNAANATYNLGILNFRLTKYLAILIKDLGKIALFTDKNKSRIQRFSELMAKDFTKRLNAIMVYMKLQTTDKTQIVSNIEKILNDYALKPLPTEADIIKDIKQTDTPIKNEDNFSAQNPMRPNTSGGRKRTTTKKNRRY
jgi:hypothetical protein